MKKPSSTPSRLTEKPKSSGFRSAIYGLLLIGASIGIGKCIYDKKDIDQQNKDSVSDTSKVKSTYDDSDRSSRGWIPVAGAEELVDLTQCRLLVLELDSRVISESEILKIADKIKNDQKDIAAEGIFANFCIEDVVDRKEISDLIAKGYKFRKIEKNSDDTWTIYFKHPLSIEGVSEEVFDLNEKSVCKILTPEEEADLVKTRSYVQKKKEMGEKIKNGYVDQVLKQFDSKKVYDEAYAHGIEKEEIIQLMIKSIDEAKKSIKSGMDRDAAKDAICKIYKHTAKLDILEEKLDPGVAEKMKNLINKSLVIQEFGVFLEEYANSLGFQVDIDDECIPYILGTD